MKLIPLNKGKFAKVDDEDYSKLIIYKWYVHSNSKNNIFYAVHSYRIKGKKHSKHILMHRLIMNLTNSKEWLDHKDRDGLNNQKSNLRLTTISQNNSNRKASGISQYLGVSKYNLPKRNLKWKAQIKKDNKIIYLGIFPYTKEGEIEAAKAYDLKAKELHGEFANLNFK